MIVVNLSNPAPDKQDAQQIETEPDKSDNRYKVLDGFYLRHYLGDSIKHAHSRQNQCDAPDNMNDCLASGLLVVVFFPV